MRLIDGDELADNIAVLFERNQALIDEWLMYQVEDAIDEAPTIDAVEVVRCKDCRYFNKYGFKLEYTECLHFDCDVSEDGYCAWGEEK